MTSRLLSRPIAPNEQSLFDRLGERLKSLRLDRGLSRQALADLTGLNPQTIYRIERGRRRTRSRTLGVIVSALGYDGQIRSEIEALAGEALAPESTFAQRVERRRHRRLRYPRS